MKTKFKLLILTALLISNVGFSQKTKALKQVVATLKNIESCEYNQSSYGGIPYDTINFHYFKGNEKYIEQNGTLLYLHYNNKETERFFNGLVHYDIDLDEKTYRKSSKSDTLNLLTMTMLPEFMELKHMFNYIDTCKNKVVIEKVKLDNEKLKFEIRFPSLREWFVDASNKVYTQEIDKNDLNNVGILFEIIVNTTTNLPIKITRITKGHMFASEFSEIKINQLSKADFLEPVITNDFIKK